MKTFSDNSPTLFLFQITVKIFAAVYLFTPLGLLLIGKMDALLPYEVVICTFISMIIIYSIGVDCKRFVEKWILKK